MAANRDSRVAAIGWFYQLARRRKAPLKDLVYIYRTIGHTVRTPEQRHAHCGLWAQDDKVSTYA